MATLRRDKMVRLAFVSLLAMVLVGVITAAAPAAGNDPPPDFSKLQVELKQAYDAGNYAKALEIAEKMHELKPEDVETMYNMACMHCLLGHKDKAYTWLEKAIDAGFKDADQMANDDDFKTIRGEDRFRDLLKQMREGGKKPDAKKPAEKPEPAKDSKKKEAEEKPAKKADKAEKADKAGKDAEKKEQPRKPQKPTQPEKAAKPEKGGKYQLSDQQRAARVEELTQAAIAASEKKDRYKALAFTLEARVLADVGLTNYNVACMYSLLDQKDDAFRYLERAIELDNMPTPMTQQMEGDTDLDNIRKDPRYAELLKRAGGGGGGAADKGDAKAAPEPQGKQVDPSGR